MHKMFKFSQRVTSCGCVKYDCLSEAKGEIVIRPTLYIRSGRSHRDVTRWFVDCSFEAASSAFCLSPSLFLAVALFSLFAVTREGGAKYDRTLNKTLSGDQKSYN